MDSKISYYKGIQKYDDGSEYSGDLLNGEPHGNG